MSADLNQKIKDWLAKDPDPQTREELQALVDADSTEELQQRFAGRLAFGTAGLRGVVGAGPARMNRLVIQQTSAGLGNYVLKTVPKAAQRGIVVAYDARLDSQRFAKDAAGVYAALGFNVYLTDRVTATPVGAFAVKHFGCAAGVVVTASHNPPEYNGYKVYWQNGAQIIPPHDKGIAEEIELAASDDVPLADFEQAKASGQIQILADDFIQEYVAAITSSPIFANADSNLPIIKVAYSAMHGVGAPLAESLLNDSGFCTVQSVAEQREPDGNFPTVNFPNPEEPGAMDAVIALAKQQNAHLACANDPDADRLAIAVQTVDGEYRSLSGDQIGILLGDYLLQKTQDSCPIVCATIVSSSMLGKIAASQGATYFETLTGFKWLTNVALDEEARHHSETDHKFCFAYEEALGYAVSREVWDKDGLSSLLAFVQLTAELVAQGRTVFDQLESLYRRFGLHLNLQQTIPLRAGAPPIGDLLRAASPSAMGGKKVLQCDDIKTGIRTLADGTIADLSLPSSDVLIYRLEGDVRVIVRPSGTEPKLKCYYELVSEVAEGDDFEQVNEESRQQLENIAELFFAELNTLIAEA